MSTFVLVHGAYSGGFYWRKTARLLCAAGHEVFTPTLTGLGERIHLVSREVGLETYIQDVVNVLEFEDLRDVILVGHSMGGMTITGVGGRVPERVAQIVYLDAYVPEAGQSLVDLMGPEVTAVLLAVINSLDGYRLPPAPDMPANWTPQPMKPAIDPVVIDHPDELAALPHGFIYCTADKEQPDPTHVPIIHAAARVRSNPLWKYIETPQSHNFIMDDPQCAANLLLEITALQELV